MEIRFSLTPRLSLLGALCLLLLLALAFFIGMRVERLTAVPLAPAPPTGIPRAVAVPAAPAVTTPALPQVPAAPAVPAPTTPSLTPAPATGGTAPGR